MTGLLSRNAMLDGIAEAAKANTGTAGTAYLLDIDIDRFDAPGARVLERKVGASRRKTKPPF